VVTDTNWKKFKDGMINVAIGCITITLIAFSIKFIMQTIPLIKSNQGLQDWRYYVLMLASIILFLSTFVKLTIKSFKVIDKQRQYNARVRRERQEIALILKEKPTEYYELHAHLEELKHNEFLPESLAPYQFKWYDHVNEFQNLYFGISSIKSR